MVVIPNQKVSTMQLILCMFLSFPGCFPEELSSDIPPPPQDVLLGKGHAINSHPGNKHFRCLSDKLKGIFSRELKRKQKRKIAEHIVTCVNHGGGRFLAEFKDVTSSSNSGVNNNETQIHPCILAKSWIVVDKEQVMLKVLHRLREKIIFYHDDEVIPGPSYCPPKIFSPMMMMQYEDRRSPNTKTGDDDAIRRPEAAQYEDRRSPSVGSATTTTKVNHGIVEANETQGTSILKMSDELDHSKWTSNASEGDERLQQARHVPDHSGQLISEHSISSGTNQLGATAGHKFDAEEYRWTSSLKPYETIKSKSQLNEFDQTFCSKQDMLSIFRPAQSQAFCFIMLPP